MPRDVVLTKKGWERTQKIGILKQLQIHFKAKQEKGVGTPFPRVPARYTPGSTTQNMPASRILPTIAICSASCALFCSVQIVYIEMES